MDPLPCLAVEHGTGQSPTTALFSVAEARPIAGAGSLAGLEEELKNKSRCPTPQGWILVRDRDSDAAAAATYLLDPRSRRRIQLPPLAIDQRLLAYCNCLLSGDPTAPGPGCVVLLVEPRETIIWYCQAGGEQGDGGEWTKHDYDIGTQGDEYMTEKIVIAPIAACRGKFYLNITSPATTVLELRPGPVFSSFPTVSSERFETAKAFLVESEGELYNVSVLHRGGAFDQARVYKMDFSDHRWRLVDHLGGRSFFVATLYFGGSCFAGGEHGIRPDCVYSLVAVPKKSFRIFNVKDGTVELHNLEQADTLETVGRSSWLLPTNPRA